MGQRGPGARPVRVRSAPAPIPLFEPLAKPARPARKRRSRPLAPGDRAERVIRWIEQLTISSGMHAGRKMVLREWQRDIVRAIYATDANGRRLVRLAVVSMGRKNAKTTLAAALALCHLAGPEAVQRGDVVSAAADREQAAITYTELRAFALGNPAIASRLIFRDFNKTVEDVETGSVFSALSSDHRTAHGRSPVVAICDEVAQWRGRELLDALQTGQGAHAEPLIIVISTRSPRPENPLEELIRYADQVQSGAVSDPSFMARIYSAPVDLDPWLESTWRLANPALGDFRSLEDVQRQAARAQHVPSEEASGRAREMSDELARRSGRPAQGIMWHMGAARDVEQRVVTTTTPGGGPGSNLIGTELRPDLFIDRLMTMNQVRALGATVLPGLVGNVDIPRLKASGAAGWVAEGGALSPSDPQFNKVSLTPKHAGVLTEMSRNMLLQSTPAIEQLIQSDMARMLAATLDAAAINGSGVSNQPLGILGTSGIGSVAMGVNGGSFIAVVDPAPKLIGALADANAEMGSLAFLTNSKVRRSIAAMVDGMNRPYGDDVFFQGIPRAYSNNVPSTLTKGTSVGVCSALIYGNWADLLIGMWSELDILVNPYESTAYSKGNVQVRAMLTCDIQVRHPESFAAIQDILTP